VKGDLAPLTAAAVHAGAEPLSLLHRAAFPDDPWSPAAIAEIAGLVGFFGLVARRDGEPVGLALAFGAGDECEIATLGVLPEWRRMGIGAALLGGVCGEARRRGARAVFLEVADDNIAARALYVANGFVSVGRRRNYYWRAGRTVDALLLRHTLVCPPTSI
jgi:[ribosomal protein S18]-alanine N-acetyltransferase